MNSFPIISISELENCFLKICNLYDNDKRKILEATERAMAGQIRGYTISTDTEDIQIALIKSRIRRTADRAGQNLLIKIIEELYENLLVNGVVRVSSDSLLDITCFSLTDDSEIIYNTNKNWIWKWKISVDSNERYIEIGLRNREFTPTFIVPDYVLQFIQQGIIAFNNGRSAASLALMAIALEGTLKDILDSPAFFQMYGQPSQDHYEITEMNIYPEQNGFRVEFPNQMPSLHNSYLNNNGDPSHQTVRIKRVLKRGIPFLEIRDAASIVDFWSSNIITNHSVININGLGTAIDIARNQAQILSPVDLPPDLDEIIATVRNKLVHLSGANLSQQLTTDMGLITIEDFLRDKNKVSDTIDSIGDTINKLYTRLRNGTL